MNLLSNCVKKFLNTNQFSFNIIFSFGEFSEANRMSLNRSESASLLIGYSPGSINFSVRHPFSKTIQGETIIRAYALLCECQVKESPQVCYLHIMTMYEFCQCPYLTEQSNRFDGRIECNHNSFKKLSSVEI